MKVVALGLSSSVFARGTIKSIQRDNHDSDEAHLNGILNAYQTNELDQLNDADKRTRLIELVRKIDLDEDDDLDEDELAQWITYVEMRWVYEDSATQFAHFDQDSDELVTREEVKKIKYNVVSDAVNAHAKFKMKQDMRRFAAADTNKDGYLNGDEFCMYLHPESYSEMNEILAFELIESLDRDGDNMINFDEYLKYIPEVPELPVKAMD